MFGYDRIIVNVAEQIINAAPLQQHQKQQKFPAENATNGSQQYDQPQKAVNVMESATKTVDMPVAPMITTMPTARTTKKSSAPSLVNGFLNEYSQYIQHQKQGAGLQMFSPNSIDSASDDSTRRLSGGSNSYGDCSGFDCGASSGYGSPGMGGTPLASPAPNSAHYFAHQLQRILLDQELSDQNTLPRDMNNAGANAQSVLTSMKDCSNSDSKWSVTPSDGGSSVTPISNNTSGGSDPVIPVDDGFSPSEIAQFAQLLCSPKKAPPQRYQCQICYQSGHYTSECPMSVLTFMKDCSNSDGKWSVTPSDGGSSAPTVTPISNNNSGGVSAPVIAVDGGFSPSEIAQFDGFSPSEIAQFDCFSPSEIAPFDQLLCSPKKTPPQRYQCHICYQSEHYTSDCPMSVLTSMKDCSNSDGKWSVTPSDGGSSAPTVTPISNNTSGGVGVSAPVIAVDDGFSPSEIAQFAQLLCSPKKAPPQRYQCHICYQSGHYISDCPMRFNSPYEELTPYQGRKKCYGEFQCQVCKRKWTSQNSVANEAQSCIKCHVAVFPHKQLPVDKAIALGLVKSHRVVPTKITPIGHGRPPAGPSNSAGANHQSHHREN